MKFSTLAERASIGVKVPVLAVLVLASISTMTSCSSSRKLTQRALYFQQMPDSVLRGMEATHEPVFQKGDILSVSVITPNESSSRLFNQVNTKIGSTAGDASATAAAGSGYLVDERGYIVFPYLGRVQAAGVTRSALTDSLTHKLRRFVDSPIVAIRLMNYKITVLGEVARPGTFSIPSERVTVLDAIGLAGDLTIFGERKNIRVIRSTGGVRETGLLDLNKGDIFQSPFFFLRQNDVVYVEMNERKIPNADQASLRNISIALGIISAVGVIISTINVLE